MNENLHISQSGINNLIKPHEGFRNYIYKDQAGRDTVYYGHLVLPGDVFLYTTVDAENYLAKDLQIAEAKIKARITVPLNQNQFDALVSLVYNIPNSIYEGTIDNRINAGIETNKEQIKNVWRQYNKVRVNNVLVESDGLNIRREKELEVFFCPVRRNLLVTSPILPGILPEQCLHGLDCWL